MSNDVEKAVNLTRLVKPAFLTLCRKPANQVAFSVVRNQTGEKTVTKPTTRIERSRVRRADPMLSILFDAALPREEIEARLASFGLKDYQLSETEEGWMATRSDLEDVLKDKPETMRVRLSDKEVAEVLKPIAKSETSDEPQGISVVRIEFSADAFGDTNEIKDWCAKNSVDFNESAVENVDLATVLRISDEKFDETRSLLVDTGVTFVIARTDVTIVPPAFEEVVNETAYGNWGWGQLDFNAILADKQFSEATSEALYTLHNLLDRILFYSSLPLNVRKTLVSRATTQFGDYVNSLMDMLPTQVLIAIRSDVNKEPEMTTKTEKRNDGDDKGTQAAAAATEQAAAAAAEVVAEPAAEGAITRADVANMISEAMGGVTTQLAALAEKITPAAPAAADANAQRTDGDGNNSGAAADGQGAAAEPTSEIAELLSVVRSMDERMQKLEGATIVRSDDGDPKQDVTRSQKPVFGGVFSNRSKSA